MAIKLKGFGGFGGNKYRAKPKIVDGIRFASTKEANRYVVLKAMQDAGEISDLVLQPAFDLIVMGGAKVGVYRADFGYTAFSSGTRIIEDVKSGPTKTAVYKLKKKIVEAVYGIKILET